MEEKQHVQAFPSKVQIPDTSPMAEVRTKVPRGVGPPLFDFHRDPDPVVFSCLMCPPPQPAYPPFISAHGPRRVH
ncbi:hypothetical protein J6590_031972 [Homalodisca vitripennis]|nr:hypothetical protein J6590_031972 [Homalodisca vitripennis]